MDVVHLIITTVLGPCPVLNSVDKREMLYGFRGDKIAGQTIGGM